MGEWHGTSPEGDGCVWWWRPGWDHAARVSAHLVRITWLDGDRWHPDTRPDPDREGTDG